MAWYDFIGETAERISSGLKTGYKESDKLVGGVLPGGPTPGAVRYRDTAAGYATGAVTTTAATPVILVGQTVDGVFGGGFDYGDAFRGAWSIGRTGSRPKEFQGFTAGDAAKGTADTFTPDFVYQENPNARDPGTQKGTIPVYEWGKDQLQDLEDWWDDKQDGFERLGKGLLVAGVLVLGFLSLDAVRDIKES